MQLVAAMVGAAGGEAAEDEGPLAGLAAGDLHALMQERTSSHLLEVSTLMRMQMTGSHYLTATGATQLSSIRVHPAFIGGNIARIHRYGRQSMWHRLQVMLGVAPPLLFTDFWERGFQGQLLELSLDGSANFVVQAAFAAMTDAAQVSLCGARSSITLAGIPAIVAGICVDLVLVCPHLSSYTQQGATSPWDFCLASAMPRVGKLLRQHDSTMPPLASTA